MASDFLYQLIAHRQARGEQLTLLPDADPPSRWSRRRDIRAVTELLLIRTAVREIQIPT